MLLFVLVTICAIRFNIKTHCTISTVCLCGLHISHDKQYFQVGLFNGDRLFVQCVEREFLMLFR
jgi:hypothetical protein